MTGKNATSAISEQTLHLLTQLTPEQYAQPMQVFHGATLGQHFRHILEFYVCLLDGTLTGVVDYGSRRRQQLLETDPQAAASLFEVVAAGIQRLDEHEPLTTMSEFSNAASAIRPNYSSSVGRELMYAYDHAVHHLALIRIGLESAFPDIVFEENLGVAPSTVKWREQRAAALQEA